MAPAETVELEGSPAPPTTPVRRGFTLAERRVEDGEEPRQGGRVVEAGDRFR